MPLLTALQDNSQKFTHPYAHWVVDSPLSDDMIREIAATPIPQGRRLYDGTRAADNGGQGVDGKLRCFVERGNIHQFPALGGLIDELLAPSTHQFVGEMIGRDLRDTYVRLEVIADRLGFWLKPHKDIPEKLMSLLIYVNVCGELEELGTEIYDERMNKVKTIPYRNNLGYLFAPAHNTWHGFEKKTIRQERRSILVNYVTFKTDWKVAARRAALPWLLSPRPELPSAIGGMASPARSNVCAAPE